MWIEESGATDFTFVSDIGRKVRVKTPRSAVASVLPTFKVLGESAANSFSLAPS